MTRQNFSEIDIFAAHFKERVVVPRGLDSSVLRTHFYEIAGSRENALEVFTYTDQLSYDPGQTVRFHSHTTAPSFVLEIIKTGRAPKLVHRVEIKGTRRETPARASVEGCNWPVTYTWDVPHELAPGAYLVRSVVQVANGTPIDQFHMLFVRPSRLNAPTRSKRLLLIACTATWTAYNCWGGSSHYAGLEGANGDELAPILSLQRPFERGLIWLPCGAPRIGVREAPGPGAVPQTQYPSMTWAFAWGYARYYAASGWAQYEQHFLAWAEANGYVVDVISQTDLHFRPELLDGYRCVTIVGHDEYWSWQMRDNIERFIEGGGNVARFGANFMWQVRLENEGARQVCYKFWAAENDPIHATRDKHLTTSAWEDPVVGRPGATTFGLNGFRGIYSGFGGLAPRASGGFTVYRPSHWAFDRTTLGYGDVFGSQAKVCSYEVDGVEYDMRRGLPFATGADGAPKDLEIIAMAPATLREHDFKLPGGTVYIGDADVGFKAIILHGEATPESISACENGAAMVATFRMGKGTVFNAGSCEWVCGLMHQEAFTQMITQNVLDRFLNAEIA